jgi:uncharacterized protein YjbI with pentapeptide repeats
VNIKKQLLPRFRWGRRLRPLGVALWLAAAVLAVALVIDQLLLLHWDIDIINTPDDPTAQDAQSDDISQSPAWWLGWQILFSPEIPEAGYVYYYRSPIVQAVTSYWPILTIFSLVIAGYVTRRAARRLLDTRKRTVVAKSSQDRRPESAARRKVEWPMVTSMVTALTAVLALVFTALSLKATRDQISLTAEGQITTRYNQAVQLLGAQGPNARDLHLGGIYALARISMDSPRDVEMIAALLTAFVRDHAPRQDGIQCPQKVDADIQAALTILTNAASDEGISTYQHNLSNTCLVGANFNDSMLHNADFTNTVLHKASFKGATLRDARLIKADLRDADLRYSYLNDTNFTDANLAGARLSGAYSNEGIFIRADLTGAVLTSVEFDEMRASGATLHKAQLQHAVLTVANFSEANLTEADFTDADLTGARLATANLTGANLTNTKGVKQ